MKLAGVLLIAGCGRVGFGPIETTTSDAAADATADSSPACTPVVDLTDDFSSQSFTQSWTSLTLGPGASIAFGTEVGFTPGTATANSSRLESISILATAGHTFAIEVTRMVDTSAGSAAEAYFGLGPGNTPGLGFVQQGGMLRSNGRVETAPYDPVSQRFWRIRFTAATAFLETSPDGAAWAGFDSAAFAGTAQTVLFGAGTTAAMAAPGEAAFDNFVYSHCP